MKNKLFIAGLILALVAAACVCNGGNGGNGGTGENGGNGGNDGNGSSGDSAGPVSIGQIQPTRAVVERNKNAVTVSEQFYDHDSIGLFGGGEGRLDFVGGLSLNLFNDTLLGDIQSEAASGSSLLARMRLEFGGFTGRLTASGKSVPFQTPNGATITVYGTDFLIVYDQSASVTTVGNFQGQIEVQVGGGPAQPVPANTFRQVLPSGEITPERPLNVSVGQFEEMARNSGSPVAAVKQLTVSIIEPEPIPVDGNPPTFELLGVDPPKIVYGSECPGSVGETRLTMGIFDESPIANAVAEWELNGVYDSRPMERIDDQTFIVVIGPVQDYGVLNVIVYAEDEFGNRGQYGPIQIEVQWCIG